tara:strand:- start:756 stop:1316 length:561 start_codon:yes stop_codon:yes gene_type:complete
MAILRNNPQVERIEPNGVTKVKEFVFEDNRDIFIPSGTPYHKIITKNKEIFFQTESQPQKYSKEIIRVNNKSDFEGYLTATSDNPPVSKYFKNKKVKPKPKDYEAGSFTRYFMQLASDDKASIIEVTKKEYNQADAIYKKQAIIWSLNKDIKEQERLNLKNILNVEKTFPQIRMKIYNFIEFGKEG